MRRCIVVAIPFWLAALAVCVMHTLDGLRVFPPHLHWLPVVAGQALISLSTLVTLHVCDAYKCVEPDEPDDVADE